MARWCPACSRPKEEHRKVAGRRVCDVRLLADRTAIDLETGEREPTGERYIPDSAQRTKRNRARFVHADRLKVGS